MDPYLFIFFAVIYTIMLVWGISRTRATTLRSWSAFLFLVLVGLILDNFILAIGRWIGEGSLLLGLNYLRYWAHAFITPTLALFSVGVMAEAGISWARTKVVKVIALLYTLALIIIELATETLQLSLAPVWEYGVLRYASEEPPSGPPLMILLVTVVLVAAGILLAVKSRWIWMLVGSVVMTIGSVVSLPVESAAVTNGFELFLMITLLATLLAQQHTKNSRLK